MNTSAEAPSVAANDSTFPTMRISGATSARSSSASTTKITARMIGMTRFRSAWLMSRTSRFCAVPPPTRASGLTASRLVRSVVTTSSAWGESAGSVSVTWNWTRPSTTFGAGAAPPAAG